MPLGGDFAVTLSQSLGNNAEVAPKNPYWSTFSIPLKLCS